MTSVKKISVIACVWNVGPYLDRFFASLGRQTCQPDEILLIDDGSTDDSLTRCHAFAAKNAIVQVIHKDNGGLVSARNVGLAHVTGQYVVFIDPDDWVDDDFLEMMYKPFQKYPDIDISFAGYRLEDEQGHQKKKLKYMPGRKLDPLDAYAEILEAKTCGGGISGKMYRKSLFDGFHLDEEYIVGEDVAANWTLFNKARAIWYQPYYGYHYVFRNNSLSHSNKTKDEWKFIRFLFRLEQYTKDFSDGLSSIIKKKFVDNYYKNMNQVCLISDDVCQEFERDYALLMRGEACEIINEMIQQNEYKDHLLKKLRMNLLDLRISTRKKIKEVQLKNTPIYIYGAGMYGLIFRKYLEPYGIPFCAYIVSDGRKESSPDKKYPVLEISSIPEAKRRKSILLVGMNIRNTEKLYTNLQQLGFKSVWFLL